MASGREEAQGRAEDARRGQKNIEDPIGRQGNYAGIQAIPGRSPLTIQDPGSPVYFAASAARAASLIGSPCGLLAMSTSVSGTNAETGVPFGWRSRAVAKVTP
jgi:hypothetical protein